MPGGYTFLIGTQPTFFVEQAPMRVRPNLRGCPSAISNAVIPSDHRSLRLSYVASGFSSHAMTSGAIQYGVPMKVFLRPIVLSNWALTPKSTVKEIVLKCVLFFVYWPSNRMLNNNVYFSITAKLSLHFQYNLFNYKYPLRSFMEKDCSTWRRMI